MLKQILLKNFKSYRDQALPLAPLTLMIGANASGKSNAIEAFRFLSWLAGGQKLSAIQHQVDDSDRVLRGSVNDLGYFGDKYFSLGCKLDAELATNESLQGKLKAVVLIGREIITATGLIDRGENNKSEVMDVLGSPPFKLPLNHLLWEGFEVSLENRYGDLHIIQEKIIHSTTGGEIPLYSI